LLSAVWIAIGLWVAVGAVKRTAGNPTRTAGTGAEEVISKAMHGVYSDLKRIGPEFAQLQDIEGATVGINRFDYETGILQRATRFKPEVFSESGCYIRLEVLYPATQDDLNARQDGGGHLVSLRNETSYAFWRYVRAGTSKEGTEFVDKVNQIITSRLVTMKTELEQL
jgi:hypothetical protein